MTRQHVMTTRRIIIRTTLWAVILLGFNPWVIEQADSNCAAVDRAMARQVKSPIMARMLNGNFTRAILGNNADGLTCALTYWRFQIDPPEFNR